MLPPGNASQLKRKTQAQSEGKTDDTPSKWQAKESRCSHTHKRQNRLQVKKGNEIKMNVI